ncbi:hypothetical protein SRB5_38000 [Streptomyces sp. RB5]|uniref:GtrA-like protein domain-containing protein n=1 Tax=Streptomyces smaragdinus TaxID=2585196 RepID=A0A7K0CJI8_9ACTN|nr:GtrA family protein [Streptomyces smaragdinus]MQY13650.1 hypothetical protein [Streptomyces smaragdinus]
MTRTNGIRQHAAAFARFVGLGGGVTLVSSAALAVLGGWLPFAAANALIALVSTAATTELHARLTFGHGRPDLRQHLQSGAGCGIGWLATTAAVAALHALRADAGVVLEQTVYLSATGLVGLGRYVFLRLAVFTEHRPAAGPVALNAPRGGASRCDSYRPAA